MGGCLFVVTVVGEVDEQADGKMDLWMNRWIHVWMD